MAREKIKLTVEKHGDGVRYRKMFKGKVWVSPTFPQDSRRNRSDAWTAFTDWRMERRRELLRADPKADRWQHVIDATRTVLKRLRDEGDRDEWNFWNDQLTLYRLVATGEKFQGIIVGLDSDGIPLNAPDPDRTDTLPLLLVNAPREVYPQPWDHEPEPVSPSMTARAVVDRYLETLEGQVKSGQRSTGLYGQTRAALNVFVDWFGDRRGMDTLDEDDVTKYHAHLSAMIGDKSRTTVASYFKLWRTFVDEISNDDPDISRPANLRSKRYTIKPGGAKVETFTVEECKTLIGLASPRLQLWLCLMLNTGMTQQDISDLQGSEVDWKFGRIIRARSKEQNAPTINWQLWRRTFDLLKDQGNREGRVLLKQDGEPLVTAGIKDDGKEWRRDAVVSSWRHLVAKAKRKKAVPQDWHRTLKQFRKTGATLIESSPYAEFVDMFLDHSRVARRHYLAGQVVPKFDEAVLWLGKQFDLDRRGTKQ